MKPNHIEGWMSGLAITATLVDPVQDIVIDFSIPWPEGVKQNQLNGLLHVYFESVFNRMQARTVLLL